MSGDGRFTTTDDPLSIGPLGGCVFCAYEQSSGYPKGGETKSPPIRPVQATTTIDTPRGPRAVCAGHALAGTWGAR